MAQQRQNISRCKTVAERVQHIQRFAWLGMLDCRERKFAIAGPGGHFGRIPANRRSLIERR